MPNYCDFTLKAAGPVEQTNAFVAHWNGLLRDTSGANRDNPAEFIERILDFRAAYPEVPQTPIPYYDNKRMGCVIDNGLVRIEAVSNWRPPLQLISAMSARWPDLEFVLSCIVEHELYETWCFRAGEISIIDLWTRNIQAHEDDEPDSWFVRNGELLNWPEWHAVNWTEKVWVDPMPDWAVKPYAQDQDELDFASMVKTADEIVGFIEDTMPPDYFSITPASSRRDENEQSTCPTP